MKATGFYCQLLLHSCKKDTTLICYFLLLFGMPCSGLMTSTEMGEQILDQVARSNETILSLQVLCHSDEQRVQRSLQPGLAADVT